MVISRRSVLKAGAVAALSSAVPSFAQTRASDGDKLILSAPLTHSDWMLKPGIEWGPPGVKHMLDACKAAGWSRVHWRVLDGGRALYESKLVRAEFKWDENSFWNPQTDEDRAFFKKYNGSMTDGERAALAEKIQAHDYATFDTLAEAVRYGHSIGLKIDAWVSINEDDHGWGLRSDFARDHPQFRWIKRDRTPYRSQLSFAFPEVRAYKLAIIDELLSNYDIDGLFIDWIRTGDVRDNPQTDANGVADSGYEKPNLDAFKSQFGVDPQEVSNDDLRWLKVRAEAQTIFMRQLRERVAKNAKRVPVCTMVGHPWHYRDLGNKIDGNLRGLLLDVATWAKEGLMDSAVAAGYYRDGGNAELAWRALREETGGKIDVWTYAWVPQTLGDFERDFSLAQKLGAKQILFWEADYIDDWANAAELKAAMSARSAI